VSTRKFSRKLVAGIAAAGATGLVAAGLLIGAGTSSAVPVSLTQTYNCPFPLIGSQPIVVTIKSDIPATLAVGQASGAFQIKADTKVNATAAQGLGLVGGVTLEGSAQSAAEVKAPGIVLPVTVPVTIPKQPIPNPPAEFTVTANGETPSLTFNQPGDLDIFVKDINLTMIARKADGTPVDFGPDWSDPATKAFKSDCTLADGQPTLLHHATIGGGPTGTSATSSTTSTTTASSTTTSTTTATSSTQQTTTASSTTTTTSGGGNGVQIGYNIKGSTTLTLLGGPVPITGTFDAVADVAAGTYVGDLKLNKTKGNFNVVGFLPITSEIDFASVGQWGGTIKPGSLTANGKLIIKLPAMTLFGIPVGGGANCQTITPSDFKLASSGNFDPLSGGKLGGTFALSKVKDCGGLNDWINPFVESTGNTLDLALTKK
jgi:hypothetical protein